MQKHIFNFVVTAAAAIVPNLSYGNEIRRTDPPLKPILVGELIPGTVIEIKQPVRVVALRESEFHVTYSFICDFKLVANRPWDPLSSGSILKIKKAEYLPDNVGVTLHFDDLTQRDTAIRSISCREIPLRLWGASIREMTIADFALAFDSAVEIVLPLEK